MRILTEKECIATASMSDMLNEEEAMIALLNALHTIAELRKQLKTANEEIRSLNSELDDLVERENE